jgi:hypothetical protein
VMCMPVHAAPHCAADGSLASTAERSGGPAYSVVCIQHTVLFVYSIQCCLYVLHHAAVWVACPHSAGWQQASQ